MSWPASAPADAFGSWSPGAPDAPPPPAQPADAANPWPAAQAAAPANPWAPAPAPQQQWPPTSGAPAPGQQWPPTSGAPVPGQQWPTSGAPAPGQAPWAGGPPAVGSASAPPPPWQGQGVTIIEHNPSRRPVWIFPAVVAIVLLLAGGTVAFVLRDRWLPGGTAEPTAGPTGAPAITGDNPQPTGTGPAQPPPTTAATTTGPPTLPAAVGSVRLDPSLDPAQAPAVAAVFDKYFSAVNARNASAALAVMDPGGSINQGDAGAVKRFSDGISTSTDDDVLLLTLGPDSSGKGLLQARVTFRSHQDAGKGPKGRESETCTRWDVTYSITKPGGGDYRIWGSTSAGNRPC
ncbi:hypothetical protein [Dactylosporangium sp. CA-139066]|uniref:hypothetical protein n=1 Tax=Dactylosporangium sp. CA-139066 TaxID=3239930 RepID=UPI003D8F3664